MGVALYHKNVFLKGERFFKTSRPRTIGPRRPVVTAAHDVGEDMICPFKSVMNEAEGKVHYLHLNSAGDRRMEGGHLFCLITKLFSYHAFIVRSSLPVALALSVYTSAHGVLRLIFKTIKYIDCKVPIASTRFSSLKTSIPPQTEHHVLPS